MTNFPPHTTAVRGNYRQQLITRLPMMAQGLVAFFTADAAGQQSLRGIVNRWLDRGLRGLVTEIGSNSGTDGVPTAFTPGPTPTMFKLTLRSLEGGENLGDLFIDCGGAEVRYCFQPKASKSQVALAS